MIRTVGACRGLCTQRLPHIAACTRQLGAQPAASAFCRTASRSSSFASTNNWLTQTADSRQRGVGSSIDSNNLICRGAAAESSGSSDRNIPANISNTEALTRTLSEISKAEGRVAKSTNVILGELGGQGETSQEKWRQLDEKVNTYPMQREFKAIGTGGDDFAQAVVAAISEVVGPIKDSAVSQRLSSQQKYTSVTVGPVWIDNSEQVIEVYAALKQKLEPRLRWYM